MNDSREISSLTGLRFVLAFWVLLYHAKDYSTGVFFDIFSKGYLGVDFFFVLSGFILSYAYEKQFLENTSRGRFGGFIRNRFARVYPVHFFTLVFSILFLNALRTWGGLTYSMPYEELPYHFLLLHAWGFIDPLYWNDPSWSISAEWFAYILLFPINAWLIRQHGRKISILTAIIGMITLLVVSEVLLERPGFIRHARYGITRILPEFLLGMSIYLYRDELLAVVKKYTVSGLALCFVCLVIVFAVNYDYFILPVIVFTLIYLLDSATPLAKLLSKKRMVYLGQISYSLYMVQLFALHLGNIFTPKASSVLSDLPFYQPWMFYFPFTIAICMIMAAATHRYIEDPARSWLKMYRRKAHGN